MKVRLFRASYLSTLEKNINSFLENDEVYNVQDIKFVKENDEYSAMVIYKERYK